MWTWLRRNRANKIWIARLNYTAGAPHRSVKSAALRMKQGFLQENELAQMIRVVGC